MSNYKQIYNLVNDAVSDFLGNQAPTVKDTSDFVSLGQTIAAADKYDAFFGALATRIAKTEAWVRLYKRNTRKIITDAQEYGAFVQKILVSLPSAVQNHVFAASDGQNPPTITRYDPHGVTTTINVSALLFGFKGVWDIEVVIPRKQIKEAFLNEAGMMVFINAVYTQIENAFQIEQEAIEALADCTAIITAYAAGNATNLLAEYQTDTGDTSLTKTTCKNSIEFLGWSSGFINDKRKYMQKMSTIYNAGGYSTFTPEGSCVVEVLQAYATKCQFKLRSNTYHQELVQLPLYNEVQSWMGGGTSDAWDDVSSVKIEHDAVNGGSEVDIAGVVAFIRDEENVKAYFSDREAWEDVNKRDGITTHAEHAEKGYGVNANANAWVFYIDDVTP